MCKYFGCYIVITFIAPTLQGFAIQDNTMAILFTLKDDEVHLSCLDRIRDALICSVLECVVYPRGHIRRMNIQATSCGKDLLDQEQWYVQTNVEGSGGLLTHLTRP